MVGSIFSAVLAACGFRSKFSPEMVTPFEGEFRFPLMQVPGRFALEALAYLAKDKSLTPNIIGDSQNL